MAQLRAHRGLEKEVGSRLLTAPPSLSFTDTWGECGWLPCMQLANSIPRNRRRCRGAGGAQHEPGTCACHTALAAGGPLPLPHPRACNTLAEIQDMEQSKNGTAHVQLRGDVGVGIGINLQDPHPISQHLGHLRTRAQQARQTLDTPLPLRKLCQHPTLWVGQQAAAGSPLPSSGKVACACGVGKGRMPAAILRHINTLNSASELALSK